MKKGKKKSKKEYDDYNVRAMKYNIDFFEFKKEKITIIKVYIKI